MEGTNMRKTFAIATIILFLVSMLAITAAARRDTKPINTQNSNSRYRLPDLVIRNMKVKQDGNYLDISGCILNIGKQTAKGSIETKYTIIDPSDEKTSGGTGTVSLLKPGQRHCFGGGSPVKKDGTYIIQLKADPRNKIKERYEWNNIKSRKIEIKINDSEKELPPFTMAVHDQANASDVILMADIGTSLQNNGYVIPINTSKLFSEVDGLSLDKKVTLAIYEGEAVIIVGETSPAEHVIFSTELAQILQEKGVGYKTILSNEVKSADLIDLFVGDVVVECKEDDGGKNYFVKGITTLQKEIADKCSGKKLWENSCNGKIQIKNHFFVPIGNQDWKFRYDDATRCNAQSPKVKIKDLWNGKTIISSIDSNGKFQFNFHGITLRFKVLNCDKQDSDIELLNKNYIVRERYSCPHGCDGDGACIAKEQIPNFRIKLLGKDKSKLEFKDNADNEVQIPLFFSNSGELKLGNKNHDLVLKEDTIINKNDFLIVTAPEQSSYTLKYKGADVRGLDRTVKFQELGTGNTIKLIYSEGAKLILGGNSFKVIAASDDTRNDFDVKVDLNGNGYIGSETVNIINSERHILAIS